MQPTSAPRELTAEDLRSLENPEELHGKKFLLSPGTEDAIMYEVIGYARARDRRVWYDVLFDDCDDPVLVDAEEMMRLLADSQFYVAA